MGEKMKRRSTILICVLFVAISALFAQDWKKWSVDPAEGFVPDEKTAIAVAIAVLKPVFGDRQIDRQSPFRADLKDGNWWVSGSLPEEALGGVATAVISKKTGEIRAIWHTE